MLLFHLKQKHGSARLYIRGNGLGLLWGKGIQLLKTGYDTWKINITYKSCPGGFRCQDCTDRTYLPDNKLQYRIMVEDREDMLGANFAVTFPVSETSSYFDVMPDFISFPWFHEHTGSLQTFVIDSKYIGERRNVTIYTPPSFKENNYKTYPTILVFDLSFDFATFFKRNFEGPILPQRVSEEYILIGFGDYKNNGGERTGLLTPTTGPFWECINGTLEDNCNGCVPVDSTGNITEYIMYLRDKCAKISTIGGRGDNTLDFLIHEAVPAVNQRVIKRLNNKLGVMGYSFGGLLACYAAWTRPHVFSFAACQSPAFWWPYNNPTMDIADFDFLNKTLKDPVFRVNRINQKIYLDAGGSEVYDPFRLAQATVEAGKIFDGFENFKFNENLWLSIDPLKNHHYVEWARRIHQALTALLPAGGAPSMPTTQAPLVG